jgi:hypothetical protein
MESRMLALLSKEKFELDLSTISYLSCFSAFSADSKGVFAVLLYLSVTSAVNSKAVVEGTSRNNLPLSVALLNYGFLLLLV